MNAWRDYLRRWRPEPGAMPTGELVRSTLAAAFTVLLVVFLSAALPHAAPLVVAAAGASAALIFSLHATPLAQPWAVVGSYLVCAMAGVASAQTGLPLPLAGALAVGLGTFGMLSLRCLHPPGGAVALFAVVGGEAVRAQGWNYVLFPVLANALMLVAIALAINNLLPGRRYPRPLPETKTPLRADPEPMQRLGLHHEDLRAALAAYERPLYVSGDELAAIVTLAEKNAYRRRFGEILCGEAMSEDVVTVDRSASLLDTWRLLRRHNVTALLVVDRVRRIEGMVALEDFVRTARARTPRGLRQQLYRLLRHSTGRGDNVGSIMHKPPPAVRADAHVAELVPAMTHGRHLVPVVDDNQRLVGVITQSDLLAALYHGSLAASSPSSSGSIQPS